MKFKNLESEQKLNLFKYKLNYNHEKTHTIYIDAKNIDEADEICEKIISNEIDCYILS